MAQLNRSGCKPIGCGFLTEGGMLLKRQQRVAMSGRNDQGNRHQDEVVPEGLGRRKQCHANSG
jgi:hypothetical protein